MSEHENEHDRGHEASRTPVPLPMANWNDPHLGDMAKNPGRIEAMVAVVFLLAIILIAGFGAAYWQNWNPWILGGTLGGGLFLLGFGLTAWGKYLMPQGPFVEDRHVLRGSNTERDSMAAALVERSQLVVQRRRLLFGLFAVGSGIFGVVALFPALRSLGPVPKKSLDVTDWKPHAVLVDQSGRPISRDTLVSGGIISAVYPKDQVRPNDNTNPVTDDGEAIDVTVVIRVGYDNLVTQKGRENWAPDGYVAYSKLCTHLGCPVGLYEQELELLVCPCHQSMFNVRNGGVPQFGPAPRPLPQLPLYWNEDGHLAAQAGYDQPVGPGFWERTT